MEMTEKQAKEKEQLFLFLCQFARQVDNGVIIIDPQDDFKIAFTNKVMTALTGYETNDFVNANLSILYGPLTNEENIELLEESLKYSIIYKMAIFSYRKNRSAFWNEMNCLPIRNSIGEVVYYYVICRDITNLIHTENFVTLERDVYAAIEEGETIERILNRICNDISLVFKKACHCSILLLKNDCMQLAGMSDTSSTNDHKLRSIHFDSLLNEVGLKHFFSQQYLYYDFERIPTPIVEILEEANAKTYWSYPIYNQEQEVIGNFLLIFTEKIEPDPYEIQYLERVGPIVSLALKYTEQKIEIRKLAYYDSKTDLPNLMLFKNIVTTKQIKGPLFIFEPSEFQNIIDVYGRVGGDELLKQLAARLKQIDFFEHAIVARYTSSSIIAVLPSVELNTKMLRDFLNKLTLESYFVREKPVYITLKIGMSKIKVDIPVNNAIQQADSALSSALKHVGTVIHTFNPALVESTEEQMNILAHISQAIINNEFFPVLQPKVNIETGEIASLESLARWISPALGFVSPADFIPLAESTGNIHRIDRQLLQKVLAWQKMRQESGKKMYQVSVNISPPHFYSPSFVEDVVTLIKSYNVDCRYIKLEITESIELENVMRAKNIICELQKYGIETAVDDFGVGYSSLSYLQELPFDEIKIDKSFIDHLSNRRVNAIVKTLVQLATDLQMKCVAEGIETKEQHEQLCEIGCQYGQGYYFYKPMQLHEIDKILENEEILI